MQAIAFILGHFVLGAVLAVFANWFGLLAWKRAASAHWTERARLVWPVRLSAIWNVVLIPIVLNEIHLFTRLEITPNWTVTSTAASLGVLITKYFFDREIFPRASLAEWFHQSIILGSLYVAPGCVAFIGMMLMPVEWGWGTLWVILVYLCLHFFWYLCLFSILLRKIGTFTPSGDRLRKIVEDAAARLGMKMPRVMESRGVQAQAYALQITYTVLFSRHLLEICSDEEIFAIAAHELAHLRESKWVIGTRLLNSLMFMPLIFISPVAKHFPLGTLLLLLSPMLIGVFAKTLSHRMEKRADETAVAHAEDAAVYARALEKIYRENCIPAVLAGKHQTHPHLYDRMLAAGVTPEYSRPKPARNTTVMVWIFAGLLVTLFVLSVLLDSKR